MHSFSFLSFFYFSPFPFYFFSPFFFLLFLPLLFIYLLIYLFVRLLRFFFPPVVSRSRLSALSRSVIPLSAPCAAQPRARSRQCLEGKTEAGMGGREAEPIASKVGKGRVRNQRRACKLNRLSPRVLLNEIKQKEAAERPLAVPHLLTAFIAPPPAAPGRAHLSHHPETLSQLSILFLPLRPPNSLFNSLLSLLAGP